MNNTQEIQNIVNQLRVLQVQQSALIRRLEQLTEAEHILNATPAAAPRRAAAPRVVTKPVYHTPRVVTASGYKRNELPAGIRVFVIGDRVRIRNPRGNQPTEGIITKITLKQITVRAPNDTLISRSPSNIIIWYQL